MEYLHATNGSLADEDDEFFEFKEEKFSFEVDLDDEMNLATDVDSDEGD